MKVCLIVGAGDFENTAIEKKQEDLLIAADGGYEHLKKLGIVPDFLIGDFDSLAEVPTGIDTIRLNKIKDETDMAEAVVLGRKRGYTDFRIYGGTGGRLDHTLANIQLAASLSQQGNRVTLYGNGYNITALTDGEMSFPSCRKGFISVFSHTDICEGVSEKGLKYLLDNVVLRSTVPLGVSNEFIGEEGTVSVKKGTLIIIYQA